MSYLVDTSVWSLAFRRDTPADSSEVVELKKALETGDTIFVTGLVLQELLQGFNKPRAYDQIVEHFGALPFLTPEREDHIEAANLRNGCRKKGIQIGTIDALLAQLCISRELGLLTTDKDFTRIAKIFPLKIWS
jgi:predicted nucleic acid-binding protein